MFFLIRQLFKFACNTANKFMALEIERKFLVKGEYKPDAFKQIRITQGYLCSVPERTVRVRIKGDKTRYLVKNTDGKHVWEIDEFYGDNDGLTVAEIELADENEPFDKPEWLGEEVTGDPKYFNSMLMKNPYKNWK